MWLSASNFDGQHAGGRAVIRGNATGLRADSIGNAVSSSGEIHVVNDSGHSAYYFDSTNSILSARSVNTHFTFITVFRRQSAAANGRFFTASAGNRLFGSHGDSVGRFFIDQWISMSSKASTEIEFYIATNENGVKNMWDEESHQQLVKNSTVGGNVWGQTVIGRPTQWPNEAAQVYLYEALVFNYVLNASQLAHYKLLFANKYSTSSFFPLSLHCF